MRLLKQSSAAQPLVFLLVSSADHLAGLTGATPTVTLRKSNVSAAGSFSSPAGTVREIGNGWYQVDGSATDTNTLGPLLLHATATGADPADVEFEIVAFDPQVTYSTYSGTSQTGDAYAYLATNWTAMKAGYLDAPISGRASQTSLNSLATAVAAMANQTDTSLAVPGQIVVPTSGTRTHRIDVVTVDADNSNTAIDMDSIVLTVINASGTSRSSRLGASVRDSQGHYHWLYTSTAGDAEEQLTFAVLGSVAGNGTWQNTAAAQVVNVAIEQFTAGDRATLNSRASQSSLDAVPTNPLLANDARLNYLDASILSRMASFTYTVPPTAVATASAVRTELATELAKLDENVSAAKTLTTGAITAIADEVEDRSYTAVELAEVLNPLIVTELERTDGPIDGIRQDIDALRPEAESQSTYNFDDEDTTLA